MADLPLRIGSMEFRDEDAARRLSKEWLIRARELEAEAARLRERVQQVRAALGAEVSP